MLVPPLESGCSLTWLTVASWGQGRGSRGKATKLIPTISSSPATPKPASGDSGTARDTNNQEAERRVEEAEGRCREAERRLREAMEESDRRVREAMEECDRRVQAAEDRATEAERRLVEAEGQSYCG